MRFFVAERFIQEEPPLGKYSILCKNKEISSLKVIDDANESYILEKKKRWEWYKMNPNKQAIIDVKVGNVLGPYSGDKIILVGSYLDRESTYVENVDIVINPKEDAPITTPIPYKGYDFELFVGDFNGDGQDEIMVRGMYDGSAKRALGAIYTYRNGQLQEIFNQDDMIRKYPLEADYLEGYKVEVYSPIQGEVYPFDISNTPRLYLDKIYDAQKKVISDTKPTASDVNGIFPIKMVGDKMYYLLIRQKIGGMSIADTIGSIERYISLKEDDIKIIDSGSYQKGKSKGHARNTKNEILDALPLGTILIDIQDIGIEGEKVVTYTLDGVPYVAVVRVTDGGYQVVDYFKGSGYQIRDFIIRTRNRCKEFIVGFELGGDTAKLERLNYCGGRIRHNVNKLPYYSKLEIRDLMENGREQLILWTRDTGKAYKISIYDIYPNAVKRTERYDRIYYPEIIAYYENLLEKEGQSSTYLYYLALASIKVGDYNKALEAIQKDLAEPYPYPSIEMLQSIEKQLKYRLGQ